MSSAVSIIALENEAGHRGHPMTTFLGHEFWPMDPKPDDMHIVDVAHHLAMQCRFNGAIRDYYSVAEHCVIGSFLIERIALGRELPQVWARQLALEFLMHDAWETWAGDMIRPIKNGSVCGAEFKKLEARGEAVVRIRWNLLMPTPALVKQIDNEMCVIEQRHRYAVLPPSLLREDTIHPEVELNFWSWQRAKLEFLKRYDDLTGEC